MWRGEHEGACVVTTDDVLQVGEICDACLTGEEGGEVRVGVVRVLREVIRNSSDAVLAQHCLGWRNVAVQALQVRGRGFSSGAAPDHSLVATVMLSVQICSSLSAVGWPATCMYMYM